RPMRCAPAAAGAAPATAAAGPAAATARRSRRTSPARPATRRSSPHRHQLEVARARQRLQRRRDLVVDLAAEAGVEQRAPGAFGKRQAGAGGVYLRVAVEERQPRLALQAVGA